MNDLLTGAENVEVVAMADIFEDQLEKNLKWLKEDKRNEQIASRVNVSPQHRFVGFEAYKKLLASDIDIVMLATPPFYMQPLVWALAAVAAGLAVIISVMSSRR